MISLAGRDILHAWGKFVFTGIGLGLLIGVTLVMAGVYRGMVDDGKALLDNSGADLWVVQKDTLGPYAESSSLNDDVYRAILAMPGVAQAANVTYLTMQVRKVESDVRTMVVGIAPGALGATPGWPPYLVAGRQITRGHYEAVADIATGFKLGDRLAIRRNHYTVVGLTRRMVSSSGDPMVFIPLKDAQEAQFLKDNDAIWQSRRRTEANPAFNRPGVPGLLDAVILAIVSAAIVAFIIYSLTMDKIREIAVLKLIGTRNRTIAAMIMQQALALGVIGFVVGKITATFSAPCSPNMCCSRQWIP